MLNTINARLANLNVECLQGVVHHMRSSYDQKTLFTYKVQLPDRVCADTPWSYPGCAGTIDPDGTYHAPQLVKAQQSYGGFQVLPNNHILNTRIDSLPVNASSTTWIAGAGTIPVNYLPSFPS